MSQAHHTRRILADRPQVWNAGARDAFVRPMFSPDTPARVLTLLGKHVQG